MGLSDLGPSIVVQLRILSTRKRTGGISLEAGIQNSQFLKQIRMPLLSTDSKKLMNWFPVSYQTI